MVSWREIHDVHKRGIGDDDFSGSRKNTSDVIDTVHIVYSKNKSKVALRHIFTIS